MRRKLVAGESGRHDVVRGLLLAHLVGLSLAGMRAGWPLPHVVAEVVLPLAGLWVVASHGRARWAKGAGALGLMYCSAVVVHVAGGVTEAHFYFFVAFGLVALYRDWVVLFAAAGFAVAHHAFFALAGGALFDQPYQLENPLFWAAVHVSFVAIVTAVQAVGMFDVATSIRARLRLESAVARADERRLTALSLHDNVVQAIATANYARELGEEAVTTRALEQALQSARELVSELLADSEIDKRVLVRPDVALGERAGR